MHLCGGDLFRPLVLATMFPLEFQSMSIMFRLAAIRPPSLLFLVPLHTAPKLNIYTWWC
jgi:hypothetical protein